MFRGYEGKNEFEPSIERQLESEKLRADTAVAELKAFKEALLIVGGPAIKASIAVVERLAASLMLKGGL